MNQLERMKCKMCGMKISWVSEDPKRNYPPALFGSYCRPCYDKQLDESARVPDKQTAAQSKGFETVIDTTDPQWRQDHY